MSNVGPFYVGPDRYKRAGLVALVTAAAAACAPPVAASPFLDQPERVPTGGNAWQDIAVLDFNGDGWPDIALAGGRTVELVLGREDGWDPVQSLTLAGGDSWGETRLAGIDLDDDDLDELVVAVPGTGKVAVLRGRDDGVLTAPPDADVYSVAAPDGSFIPAPSAALDVGDLDGDDDADVVALFRPASGFDGKVVPLVNDSHGVLAAGSPITVTTPTDVHLLQLGGDVDLDLVVAQGTGPEPPPPAEEPQGILSLLAGGTGASFGTPTTANTPGDARGLAAGDLTADGTDDLLVGVIGRNVHPGPQLLPGSSTAAELGAPSAVLAAPPLPLGPELELGDVDRDGRLDVAVNDIDNRGIRVITTAPNGARRLESGAYIFPDVVSAWRLADVDVDGKLDLVVLADGSGGPPLRIYYGRGPVIQSPARFVDFGEVTVGAASSPVGTQFTNWGPGRAVDLTVIGDGHIDDFELLQDDCTAASLEVGEGCAMAARFRPRAAGYRELDVAVVAEDSDEAVWLTLVGTGVNPARPGPTSSGAPVGGGAPAGTATKPANLSRRRGPRLLGRGRKLRFDSGWRASCPVGGPVCRVTLLLVGRARPGHRAPVLARFSFTVMAGAARDVTGRLTRAGRRALGRGRKVRAVMRIKVVRTPAADAVAERGVTLRLGRAAR